jgi:protein gp37
MGGRKGYTLRKLIHNTREIKEEQKSLYDAIKHNNPQKAVYASAKILAKSDIAIDAIAHSFLFMSEIGTADYNNLNKKNIKERRKELTKKWSEYRKGINKTFDPSINRDIIDSATRTIGGNK